MEKLYVTSKFIITGCSFKCGLFKYGLFKYGFFKYGLFILQNILAPVT